MNLNYKGHKHQGIYFTGKSSRPIQMNVTVTPFYIQLEPCDAEGEVIKWKHEEVLALEDNNQKTILKFGQDFPCPMLEVRSTELIKDIREQKPDAHYLKSPYHFFKSKGVRGILIGIVAIIGVLLAAYLYVIPAVMEGLASVIPVSMEKQMGAAFKQSFLIDQNVDSTKTEAINKFYDELKVPTDYDINITVVNSDVQNAFALPGGEIVVFSGIVDNMKSYQELVALLGHEAGHIEKRHSLKLLMKNMANYIIISAILQDFSGIMSVIIENAASLEQLSYNREKEEESDEFGYAVMKENKVDPNGMVQLFEQLQQDGMAGEIPEFLQTHPKLDSRIETTKMKIKKEPFPIHQHPELEAIFNEIKGN